MGKTPNKPVLSNPQDRRRSGLSKLTRVLEEEKKKQRQPPPPQQPLNTKKLPLSPGVAVATVAM